MIVFDRQIFFCDEKKLNDEWVPDNRRESITVREVPEIIREKAYLKTDWILMTGRNARYLSDTPFQKATQPFSWALEIDDLLTLAWHADTRLITYSKGRYYTPERLRFWIVHTFLPLILELERTYRILHVGAVEIEGKPILFSAFSFGGKSTMVEYCLKQGHLLLSDDSLGIDKREDGYYAIASYPFCRPYREMETLGRYTKNVSNRPKPVHAVYVLDKRDPNSSIEIVELKGIEKFQAFHYSTFIDFDFMKKERFDFFTQMAEHVPVYKITYSHDITKLPAVYDVIVEHSRSL